MVKVRILRDMLILDTAYSPGDVADVAEDRAVDLLARGHATALDPPPRELEGRIAARKAELLVENGTPPRPKGAFAALRDAFGHLPG
jgi:hypothetical protein